MPSGFNNKSSVFNNLLHTDVNNNLQKVLKNNRSVGFTNNLPSGFKTNLPSGTNNVPSGLIKLSAYLVNDDMPSGLNNIKLIYVQLRHKQWLQQPA